MKFVEYEEPSGRIRSELFAVSLEEAEQIKAQGCGVLEVDVDDNRDWGQWVVKDGELVKVRETAAERKERTYRLRMKAERARKRASEMFADVAKAILEGDGTAIKNLRTEYKKLKDLL